MKKLDKIVLGVISIIMILFVFTLVYDESIPRNKVQTHVDGELGIPTWMISYNFKSTSYSAHNDIDLKIVAQPLANYVSNYTDRFENVNTIQIHIPDSYDDDSEYEYGRLLSNVMVLEDDDKNGVFEGEGTFKFDSGGEKCVVVKENERLETSVRTCENKDSLIEISDPEKFLEIKTNKAILLLSLIFSIGVLIQVRNWIRDVLNPDSDNTIKEEHVGKTSRFTAMSKQKKHKKFNSTKK